MSECDFWSDKDGILIPKPVWDDKRLNALDKVILSIVDCIDKSDGSCLASNEYLAEVCQCSVSKVSKSISALIDLGYVCVKSFDGRKRELKSTL